MSTEKHTSKSFFDLLSKLTSLWLKELTDRSLSPVDELTVLQNAETILEHLKNIETSDDIHRKIINKAIPIIEWLIEDIKKTRITKAVTSAVYGQQPENLLEEEKKKIKLILQLLLHAEKPAKTPQILDTNKIEIPVKEKQRVLVLTKTPLKDFVGSDSIWYRGLAKNTVAHIPKHSAEILKKRLKDLLNILE